MSVSGQVTAQWHLWGPVWGTCGGICELGHVGSGTCHVSCLQAGHYRAGDQVRWGL